MRHLFLFICLIVSVSSCDNYNKLLKSSDYELKLTKANEYYKKENYIKASGLYEELIPVYKGTEKAEEIYYYYSYCTYYQGDYSLAQYHFKNYYRSFPTSKHAEECLFLNAYCYYLNSPYYTLDQTDTKNAIKEMQGFVDQFPESSRIDTCNTIIDKLRGKLEHKEYDITKQYHNISDYKAAISSSQNFIKEYPDSKYIDELRYIIIHSYYLLAINSIETKKLERLDNAIENYLKFVDLSPKSNFALKAESVYESCLKLKKNITTQQ